MDTRYSAKGTKGKWRSQENEIEMRHIPVISIYVLRPKGNGDMQAAKRDLKGNGDMQAAKRDYGNGDMQAEKRD